MLEHEFKQQFEDSLGEDVDDERIGSRYHILHEDLIDVDLSEYRLYILSSLFSASLGEVASSPMVLKELVSLAPIQDGEGGKEKSGFNNHAATPFKFSFIPS